MLFFFDVKIFHQLTTGKKVTSERISPLEPKHFQWKIKLDGLGIIYMITLPFYKENIKVTNIPREGSALTQNINKIAKKAFDGGRGDQAWAN